MLDLHTTEFGYPEIAPPYLVRDETAFGTGNLPKSAEDMFRTTDGMWLIPTAEMPLTNLVSGEISMRPRCHCALRHGPRVSARKPGRRVATRAA